MKKEKEYLEIKVHKKGKKKKRIESSKETQSVPSVSDMSEIAACFPSPVADDPSALLSPTFLSSSQ